MRFLPLVIIVGLAACEPVVTAPAAPRAPVIQQSDSGVSVSRRQALNNFGVVARRVEPLAEEMCRARAPQLNCDFRIVIDNRPNLPPNAFQTLDDNGRPIIAFTVPLIFQAQNRDEIAFVMAHEAAHHIAGHIPRQRQNAIMGATIFGALIQTMGPTTPEQIDSAQQLGAAFGARSYSNAFELEADALGTIITDAAGFDPLVGAQFFFRIPDPGDRFLGTHPANADRLRTVQRVAAGL